MLTGSHLDSVLDGGAYDGPLGVVSALAAIDLLRERGAEPGRAVGVGVFREEEGSRFGLACLGSRLATGSVPWAEVEGLTDRDGVALGDLPRPRRGPTACCRRRLLRGAARRAGAGARRPRRADRPGERDLAARSLPLRLHRPRRPRGHHPDGGPGRPDADLRDDRARRQQAGPAGRPARDVRPGRGRTRRHQRRAVARHRLARRARRLRDDPRGAGRRDREAGLRAGRARRHHADGDGRVGLGRGGVRRRPRRADR